MFTTGADSGRIGEKAYLEVFEGEDPAVIPCPIQDEGMVSGMTPD